MTTAQLSSAAQESERDEATFPSHILFEVHGLAGLKWVARNTD